MKLQGAGAPGTVDATVDVRFAPADGGGTEIAYEADATVGGMVGGVGQRMLGSVSKRMAGEFFGNVGKSLIGERPAVAAAAAGAPAERRRPPAPARGLHRPAEGRRHLLAGRLPQGHRRRRRPGARRRRSWAGSSGGGGEVGAARDTRLHRGSRTFSGCNARERAGTPAIDRWPMSDLTVDSTAREHGAGDPRPSRSRRASCSTSTSPGSPSATPSSTRSSASTRSAPARARPRPTRPPPAGDRVGPLHGLPHAFKDTHDVAGWRTTYGSPLYADHVPDADDLARRADPRAPGSVTIGKTNVPEFAAGSHTFNTVFGTTLNPVDPTRSAGGSSGGAACALAAGHGAARRRLRHGRVAAQPRVVLRRGRAAARRSAGCRSGRPTTTGTTSPPAARWPATSATWRCCCR